MGNINTFKTELVRAILDGSVDSKWSLLKMEAADCNVTNVQGLRTVIEMLVKSQKEGTFEKNVDMIKLEAADVGVEQSQIPILLAFVKMEMGIDSSKDEAPNVVQVSEEEKVSGGKNVARKINSFAGAVEQVLKHKLLLVLCLICTLICPFFVPISFIFKILMILGCLILFVLGLFLCLYFNAKSLKHFYAIYSIILIVIAILHSLGSTKFYFS